MIEFDGMATRAIGSLGAGGLFTGANDTGEDFANHHHEAIVAAAGHGPGELPGGLVDVAGWLLGLIGLR